MSKQIKPSDIIKDVRNESFPKPPKYSRPPISFITDNIGPDKVKLYVGDSDGASDIDLLNKNGITTIINCAVNLDVNYVVNPKNNHTADIRPNGTGTVRVYKIGLIDGFGNTVGMFVAGFLIMQGALLQIFPDKDSYPLKCKGNILVHCRGGRSRSVIIAAMYLFLTQPERFPSLLDALKLIQKKREIRADELFECPKEDLIVAANEAIKMIQTISTKSFN